MKPGIASRLLWSAYTLAHASREKRLPWAPHDRLLQLQSRRVQAIVRFAWRHVPFYRQAMQERGLSPADFRTADDLARLPLIDGNLYSQAPHLFQPTGVDLGTLLTLQSSGTTGRTKYFTYDGRALFLALAHGHRQRHVLARYTGRLAGYRELNVAQNGSVSAQIRAFFQDHLWTPRRADLTRAFLWTGDLPVEAEITAISEFQPDVLMGYGSYLGALFRAAGVRGLPIHRPRALVYGADSMSPADRDYIETQFNIPVFSFYQASESLRIAFQCELRLGHHISLDSVAVRIADPAGQTLPPGQPGDIVISNLTNRATVLLNYRLGDLAAILPDPCPCGRTLPVLRLLEGRSDDLIRLAGGRFLHAFYVVDRLRSASGVDRLQLIQEDFAVFRICAVADGTIDRQAAAAALASELSNLTGAHATCSVDWVDTLPAAPNGKTRLVISRVRP